MKQANDFAYDMLDLDVDREKTVYCAGRDMVVSGVNGVIILDIPFDIYTHEGIFRKASTPSLIKRFFLSSRGTSCLRFTGPVETGSDFGDIAKKIRFLYRRRNLWSMLATRTPVSCLPFSGFRKTERPHPHVS